MSDQKTSHKTIQYIRSAFTQIELIFVIIIVGVLAVVALPRLAETADNARLAMDISNMSTCIRETASYYALYNSYPPENSTSTCDTIVCYTININDINFTVSANSEAENYCSEVEAVGGHLVKSYQF